MKGPGTAGSPRTACLVGQHSTTELSTAQNAQHRSAPYRTAPHRSTALDRLGEAAGQASAASRALPG